MFLSDNKLLIGTAAVRTIDSDNKVIEPKRFFILPYYRGKGYGRLLSEHAINYARKQQYNKSALGIRKRFSAAQHIYRNSGFRETEKYNDNEQAELYFEPVIYIMLIDSFKSDG